MRALCTPFLRDFCGKYAWNKTDGVNDVNKFIVVIYHLCLNKNIYIFLKYNWRSVVSIKNLHWKFILAGSLELKSEEIAFTVNFYWRLARVHFLSVCFTAFCIHDEVFMFGNLPTKDWQLFCYEGFNTIILLFDFIYNRIVWIYWRHLDNLFLRFYCILTLKVT